MSPRLLSVFVKIQKTPMNQSGDSLKAIIESIDKMTGTMVSISEASEKQLDKIEEINTSVNHKGVFSAILARVIGSNAKHV